jgi:hypothetical protein
MIIKYECESCNTIFEDEHWRKRKYCSNKCANKIEKKSHYKKGHKHDKKTEKKRIEKIRNNPSYGMLGKKHSEITKIKMSESSKKPYNYIDGGYYKKVKIDKCQICNKKSDRILIHHKDKNRENNKKRNLLAVCDKCHSKIHFPDGKIGKNYKRW